MDVPNATITTDPNQTISIDDRAKGRDEMICVPNAMVVRRFVRILNTGGRDALGGMFERNARIARILDAIRTRTDVPIIRACSRMGRFDPMAGRFGTGLARPPMATAREQNMRSEHEGRPAEIPAYLISIPG